MSAISELTSTIAIAKISNGSLDVGHNNGEIGLDEVEGSGIGGNHHNGARGGDDLDATGEMTGPASVASAPMVDRLQLSSPAPPPLKIDTGQSRIADRDRDRDWAGNNSSNNKMSHNHVVTLINNSNTSNSPSGANNAGSSANNNKSGDSKNSGSKRPTHNHPQQLPIAGNLVNIKVSSSNHVSTRYSSAGPVARLVFGLCA